MIEVFDDRIEISIPEILPSKNIDRLIRTTPESRNEILQQHSGGIIFAKKGFGF